MAKQLEDLRLRQPERRVRRPAPPTASASRPWPPSSASTSKVWLLPRKTCAHSSVETALVVELGLVDVLVAEGEVRVQRAAARELRAP